MSLLDLLYSVEPLRGLAFAVGLSIVLYALGANLAWVYRSPRPGRLGRFAQWAYSARVARAVGELLRWLYYLAAPWAALMLGYDSVRALGVWNLDWAAPAINLALLAAATAAAFIWIWRPYAQVEHPHSFDSTGWNWARHAVEVIYQEAHWAFYRSGPVLWLGDSYWGSFFGLALVLIEGWSNPAVRSSARDVTRADAPLWNGSIAIVSAIVFIFTQNSWYCLLVHLLLDVGLRGLIGFPHTPIPDETYRSG